MHADSYSRPPPLVLPRPVMVPISIPITPEPSVWLLAITLSHPGCFSCKKDLN